MKLTILYDGECPICQEKKAFLEKRDRKKRLRFVDIRDPDFQPTETGRSFKELEARIHAVLPDGGLVAGMDAIRAAWRAIGLGWLVAPSGWPLLRPAFDALYTFVARNRHKISRFLKKK